MTVAGLGLLAVGIGWLSLIRPDGNFWVDVLPSSLVATLGMSLAFIPSLGTASSAAPGGGWAGLGHRQHQLSGRVRAGPGAMTALAASWGADRFGDLPALTAGFSAAFIGAAVIAAAGGLFAAFAPRTPGRAPASGVWSHRDPPSRSACRVVVSVRFS